MDSNPYPWLHETLHALLSEMRQTRILNSNIVLVLQEIRDELAHLRERRNDPDTAPIHLPLEALPGGR